jgi:hypothetical protein
MGTVTGTTQDKLHLVKTYDPTQPYIVGRNGVTAVYTDVDGIDNVTYVIDGIKYNTKLIKELGDTLNKPINISAINMNSRISSSKSFVPTKDVGNSGRESQLGPSTPLDIVYPTTFEYTTQPYAGSTSYFVFKDEVKMGVVFTPKVEEDVFIERQSMSVFEPQTRLGEIISLEGLEEYNNGYYNITKNE